MLVLAIAKKEELEKLFAYCPNCGKAVEED